MAEIVQYQIHRKRISPFIVFLILYCLLASAYASMTIGYNPWLEFASAIVCFFYFSNRKALRFTSSRIIASIFLVLGSMYMIHGGSVAGHISMIMNVSLAVVLINLKEKWRVELFSIVSKWFSILLVLSILTWLIHFIIPLPHITIVEEAFFNVKGLVVNNYFFFKESMFFEAGADSMQRFQGMFLEPGHLGTIVVFFLICNRFDFKRKECWVFLFSVLLSLSASAYTLLAIGYLFYKASDFNILKVLGTVLFSVFLIVFFVYYNGGDNVVDNMIFTKLIREEGAIQGRVNHSILVMFNNMWSSGQDLFFGKGWEIKGEGSAGFIYFFVCNGILGCLLCFLAYYCIYFSCKSKYGFYVLIMYIISFLQRAYPYWDAFTFPFILGLPFFVKDSLFAKKNKNSTNNRSN